MRKKIRPANQNERRKDFATADFIQIGHMYIKIFGRSKGLNYFKNSHIKPRIYHRILLGIHRGSGSTKSNNVTDSFLE